MRLQKRINIFDENENWGDWPPNNARECVAWFSNKLNEIPNEYADIATIEIEGLIDKRGYECAHISIYYFRPETDEEIISREASRRLVEECRVAEELRRLAELKAKYES